MFSAMQLLSFLSIILGIISNEILIFLVFFSFSVIFTINYTHAVPISSIESEESNIPFDEQINYVDDETSLYKRKLPVEGILIGRRSFPNQGIMLGRRDYPTEGILLGKREYPSHGAMLGRRNFRFFVPKTMA